jgi:hypothetical protein
MSSQAKACASIEVLNVHDLNADLLVRNRGLSKSAEFKAGYRVNDCKMIRRAHRSAQDLVTLSGFQADLTQPKDQLAVTLRG